MFKLTDPFGSAPSKPPFMQSVSTGVPWHNLPVTREYTLGQLLDQTIARCGENDAVVYADRDYRLTWYEFGEEVDLVAKGLMARAWQEGDRGSGIRRGRVHCAGSGHGARGRAGGREAGR